MNKIIAHLVAIVPMMPMLEGFKILPPPPPPRIVNFLKYPRPDMVKLFLINLTKFLNEYIVMFIITYILALLTYKFYNKLIWCHSPCWPFLYMKDCSIMYYFTLLCITTNVSMLDKTDLRL